MWYVGITRYTFPGISKHQRVAYQAASIIRMKKVDSHTWAVAHPGYPEIEPILVSDDQIREWVYPLRRYDAWLEKRCLVSSGQKEVERLDAQLKSIQLSRRLAPKAYF